MNNKHNNTFTYKYYINIFNTYQLYRYNQPDVWPIISYHERTHPVLSESNHTTSLPAAGERGKNHRAGSNQDL